MKHHTAHPHYPHPDDTSEPEPWPLADSVAFAIRVLRDPLADQWTRTRAADELSFSFDAAQDDQK